METIESELFSAFEMLKKEVFMKVREIVDNVIQKTGVTPLAPEKTCDKLMAGELRSRN